MPGHRIEIPARAATGEPAQLRFLPVGSALAVTGMGLHRGRGGLIVDRAAQVQLHRALGDLLAADDKQGEPT